MNRTRIISIAVFVCMLIVVGEAHAQIKIDPFFDALGHFQDGALDSAKAASLNAPSPRRMIGVFIQSRDVDATAKAVEAIGGSVGAVVSKELFTAQIPHDALSELAARADVVFIEAAKPIETRNDVAMHELNGYEVHEGLDMPSGFSGAGVIMGIIDTGIDLTHNDFLGADGKSRILFAWDQQSGRGPSPKEILNSYGVECDASMIASGSCPMSDSAGHGTHIAGTAAGRHGTYGGVAPDANIIAVRYRSELLIDGYAVPVFSTTICEAAYYVFKKAENLGMPAVVNLSLGSHIGAHDGNSLFEKCLDALVEDSSGRAIVAAAGNERITHPTYKGLHAGYDVAGDMGTNFRIRTLTQGNIFYLDTWLGMGSTLAFGIAVRETATGKNLGSSGMIALGEADTGTFDGGNITWQINATETASPLNGRPHVGITIVLGKNVSNPEKYDFDLLVSGSGSFDAWWYPDKSSSAVLFTSKSGPSGYGYTYVPGDNRMNVAIPATARNVIAVGGYASRTSWDRGGGCCQVAFTLGDLLPFSSVGPSANPSYTGYKPQIVAPGAMIASAKSSGTASNPLLDLPDGSHTLAAGTSMATPFVSGTIALMFSANASYTYDDARRYIEQSAYTDAFTGATPNDAWGYGKLDILAAVQTAVIGGPTGSSINASLALPAEAAGASSSCSMRPGHLSGTAASRHMLPMLVSILSMAAVIWTSRQRSERKRGRQRMKDDTDI